MTDRVEDLLDQFLDAKLRRAPLDIESLIAARPGLGEAERERLRRLAGLLEGESSAPATSSRDRVGPYRILREIGRGGQGTVFLAEDTRFARRVALKVLATHGLDLQDDRMGRHTEARLKREAEVVSRLDHPGICVVHEMGSDRNDRYIAMRYVEGETLAKKIAAARAVGGGTGPRGVLDETADDGRNGGASSTARRTVDGILALVERSARALHVAHEAGVIHRDVKPGNIMVTPRGDPVLLDFGLASDVEHGTSALTVSGGLVGTPAYMSPEQLSSSSSRVDRRSDVYSLGVTLYECLTLARPFEGATRELLYRSILSEPPPDARALNRSVSRDLWTVIETALEKDLDHRYQTALDLAEDLRRVREREPILARPAGFLKRKARWVQRNPGLAASVGGLFAALTVGLAATLYSLGEAREAQRESDHSRLLAQSTAALPSNPTLALLLAIESAERRSGPESNRTLLEAIAQMRERRVLDVHPRLVQCVPSPDRRWFVTSARDQKVQVWDADRWSVVATLAEPAAESPSTVFTADGSLLAMVDRDGACRVWRTSSWTSAFVLPDPSGFSRPSAFDPTGRHLLSHSVAPAGGEVRLWDVEKNTFRILETTQGKIAQCSFSADGRRILVVTRETGVHVWNLEADVPRMVLEVLNPVSGQDLWAVFSPDGGRILVSSRQTGISLWDIDSGACRFALDPERRGLGPVAFRGDGEQVLVPYGSRRGAVFDAESARVICLLDDIRTDRGFAAFSPDGTRILADSTGLEAAVWDAVTGRMLAAMKGHESGLSNAHFSRSGATVVTASIDGTVREWALQSEGERFTYRASRGNVRGACFDPARRRLAVTTDLGFLEVIDADSRAVSSSVAWSGYQADGSLTFSSRGEWLLTTDPHHDPPLPSENLARSWNAATGASKAVFEHPAESNVYDARFSLDERFVVTAADDRTARVWSAETGTLLRELKSPTGGLRTAAFDSGGERVITASEMAAVVRVWDWESGSVMLSLETDGARPIDVCFSPDDRWALAGGWDGFVALWDASTGDRIRRWTDCTHHVRSVAFSADGRLILTACKEEGVRLWSRETGDLVLRLGGQTALRSAAFSVDGKWIIAASERDGAAHVWPVDPLGRAREIAPRKLTPTERARYGLSPLER